MTAQVLPEPAGPVQLLEAGPGATAPGSGQAPRHGLWPDTDDKEARCLVLVGAGAADVSRIRRLAHDFLVRLRVPPSACEDALLIISELVTNAVVHALPPAALRVRCMRCGALRIEVIDGGSQSPLPSHTDSEDEHGRGMFIVATLATRHGTVTHERGAMRWAELCP
ncbi:ATP-binding protein [Streptomyces wuyuanensis]|uniref:Anti-sigma regulatory factor (Ser/Thr protein kinase) n=1 Tax=Streptomyces wuyuanensis TaxID=1196353 RepID=A0A1H0A376_9ACTN|nr:Anti-sigma regulatory factor (Ser/Thr protein kinase) [Streptomyces wuyuanensis]